MVGQIVAMGGGGFMTEADSPLDDFMLACSPAARPRICFVPTPAGDSDRVIAAFYEAFSKRNCEPTCLRIFGTPEGPVDLLASQDVIYVSGGNTANALALWRLHGVDEALRDAWRRGAVLGGVSAGANCWFECSVTDSLAQPFIHFTTASDSCREASAPTTTARSSGGPPTGRLSTTDSRRATQPTTLQRSTSSATSCVRSSARALARMDTASRAVQRLRSPPAVCDGVFLRTL